MPPRGYEQGMTLSPPRRLTQYAARRRVRLQDPARRARAGRWPACRAASRRRTCWWDSMTATTPPSSAWTPADRAGRHRRLLHAGRRRPPTTGAGSPRPTRSPTSTRWAAAGGRASTCWAGRVTSCPLELAAEVLPRRAGRRRAGRLPPRRRSQHRRPGAEVRHGRHRDRRPERLLRNDAGRGRPAADSHQAARRRRPQQPPQGDRRGLPAGRRDDGRAQRRRLAGRARRRASRAPPTSPASDCSATSTSWPGPAASTAVIDAAAVPYLDGARESLRDGFVSGGTRRNLDWVRPRLDVGGRRGRAAAARRRADLRRAAGRRRDPGPPGGRSAGGAGRSRGHDPGAVSRG